MLHSIRSHLRSLGLGCLSLSPGVGLGLLRLARLSRGRLLGLRLCLRGSFLSCLRLSLLDARCLQRSLIYLLLQASRQPISLLSSVMLYAELRQALYRSCALRGSFLGCLRLSLLDARCLQRSLIYFLPQARACMPACIARPPSASAKELSACAAASSAACASASLMRAAHLPSSAHMQTAS